MSVIILCAGPGGRPPGSPRDRGDPSARTPLGYGLGMDVRDYVESNASEFIGQLKQWLAIPSISADPDRHPDVRLSAEWLAGHLRAAGFPVAEVWETGGLPAGYAEWPAAGPQAAPGVVGYGHHDVHPADALAAWDH